MPIKNNHHHRSDHTSGRIVPEEVSIPISADKCPSVLMEATNSSEMRERPLEELLLPVGSAGIDEFFVDRFHASPLGSGLGKPFIICSRPNGNGHSLSYPVLDVIPIDDGIKTAVFSNKSRDYMAFELFFDKHNYGDVHKASCLDRIA